jgi:hypothetical protein
MLGEELNATIVSPRGVLGDRAFALIDPATGKVASAKNPRKWAKLFDFRASYIEPPEHADKLPPIRITLPDGTVLTSEQRDVNRSLSEVLGREALLTPAAPSKPSLEEYWPDIDGLPHRETITDESMPPGTFFDLAVIHLMTTATLERLRELYPDGRFEVRRFRPNIVVEAATAGKGFVEDSWIGRTLAVGEEVRLSVTGPCPRCVMTTLPQADLPRDPGILRTAVQHNQQNVGIYAGVLRGGTIRRGDPVALE